MKTVLCFSSSKNKGLLIPLWFPSFFSPLPSFQDSRAKSSINNSSHLHSYHLLDLLQMGFRATALTLHLLSLLTMSDWPSIKEWSLSSSYLTSPKSSILFVTISFCIRFLTFVCPILSSTSSSLISLADLSVFADRVAHPIHPGHLFSPAFLKT